ncbi:hypothetical protein [Kribbella kalugense]|uniref:Uncharacterized protein n=1 Tax=Kribbella kalugense TaxID=2512221 RepID=A0A4R8A198_9ACTN|nr:hypothetical protein [Kribbella kalugense]TDW24287.1 hypothetical protein EV650_3161 [Kribbella kalugense]
MPESEFDRLPRVALDDSIGPRTSQRDLDPRPEIASEERQAAAALELARACLIARERLMSALGFVATARRHLPGADERDGLLDLVDAHGRDATSWTEREIEDVDGTWKFALEDAKDGLRNAFTYLADAQYTLQKALRAQGLDSDLGWLEITTVDDSINDIRLWLETVHENVAASESDATGHIRVNGGATSVAGVSTASLRLVNARQVLDPDRSTGIRRLQKTASHLGRLSDQLSQHGERNARPAHDEASVSYRQTSKHPAKPARPRTTGQSTRARRGHSTGL